MKIWVGLGFALLSILLFRPALAQQIAEDWFDKGNALYYEGKYDEAIKAWDKAIEINPLYTNALSNKGLTLCHQSKYDEAIKCYDRAIEINPQLAEVWNNKGLALYIQGKYDEAIKCYDKAIEINPRYADAWNSQTGEGAPRCKQRGMFAPSHSMYEAHS